MKFCIFLLITSFFTQTTLLSVQPKQIKWKKLATEEQVRITVFAYLPVDPSIEDITRFLKTQKAYYSVHKNVVYVASKSWSTSFMISKCWLLEFHFDESNKFVKFNAKTSLTGP